MEKKGEMTIYEKSAMERIRYLIDQFCDGSQQQFVDKTQINKASVSQYVNGKNVPSNITAAKIAGIFNVNPAWLMGFDVPMERPADIAIQEPSSLSPQEMELVRVFRSFNNEGREKVMDYVQLLERDGSYIKNNENAVVG